MMVSIIVPARNEEACLGECLRSLAAQEGVPFEILVVDDGSTDGTAAIVSSFPGVRLLRAAAPPAGESGKCHAAWMGAQAATGDWLLFTDADTVHKPDSLARCLREAQDSGAALLSLSPEQEVHGVLQQAAMAVIFAELARKYRPKEVSDPALPVAAANGQYLLIRRDVYEKAGGHAAVAHTLLEDVALAVAVKRAGGIIRFRYGGDSVRTRMYRSWPELREGWTKNLALLFPRAERLAALRLLEFFAGVAGWGSLIGGLAERDMLPTATGLILATAISVPFFWRILRAHFGWRATLVSPLGLPVFAWLLLRSRWKHGTGRVSWKGRTYDQRRSASRKDAHTSNR